jgi:hypothetical protein
MLGIEGEAPSSQLDSVQTWGGWRQHLLSAGQAETTLINNAMLRVGVGPL